MNGKNYFKYYIKFYVCINIIAIKQDFKNKKFCFLCYRK